MALNTHLSVASWDLALNAALVTPLDSGIINIYTGTQPATPDTAVTTQTLLVTLTLNATAFGSASAGTSTAGTIVAGTAGAAGTATWFRAFKTDTTTAVLDGSVGVSGCDLNITSTAIGSGDTVSATSWTVSMPTGQ